MTFSPGRNILILYTELAGYTLASLRALRATQKVVIHLVRYPVNAEAPFDFEFDDSFRVYDRTTFTEEALVKLAERTEPALILCSGWNDKAYLAVCKVWNQRIPVVLAMDNKWLGTLKQQLARVVSRFTIRKSFSACWVPGEQQKEYALKLGFSEDIIRTGFYTCDTDHFHAIYQQHREAKQKSFPHVFIYAGRYYDFKGITELWQAFIELKNQTNNNWKLVCLGTGDVQPIVHPEIEHKGFVQPAELAEIMAKSGVFILPSRVEPWGVVVQEFAAAGFPLLLSKAVGAKEAFLEEGVNGLSFPPNSRADLFMKMKRMTELSDEKLSEMGESSHALAMKNTPDIWAKTLLSFLKNT